jgi:nucleoside permease NupC
MTFILAILFIMFVLGPIARAIAVSIEKSGEKRALETQTGASEQLVALSEQMYLLAERVDRLSEEQSFLLSVMEKETRLLEEQGVAAPGAGEDTST